MGPFSSIRAPFGGSLLRYRNHFSSTNGLEDSFLSTWSFSTEFASAQSAYLRCSWLNSNSISSSHFTSGAFIAPDFDFHS